MQLSVKIIGWIVNSSTVLLSIITTVTILTACNTQGVVVFAPTESPPGSQLIHFQHPSGSFSLDVPDDWAIYAHDSSSLAAAFFTPPGAAAPALEVAAINLGNTAAGESLSSLISDYVEILQSTGSAYSEQDRQQLPDGSWRITGIRSNVGGEPQAINMFIMQQDTILSVANIILTEDTNVQSKLERAVNSLSLAPASTLSSAPLDILASFNPGPVTVTNAFSWSTPEGIYFVTGEVTNTGIQPVTSVPVHARLLTPEGETTDEASDTTMGLQIAPGQFAPFSLRFGQGLPDGTSTFVLTLGSEEWRSSMTDTPSMATESLTWDSSSSVTTEGHLVISGTVTNMGETRVEDIIAIITVFDAKENVIAAGFVPVDEPTLAAGESSTFTIRVSEMGNSPENFIVDVQGVLS
jgi:hypothetical protein